VEILNAVEGIGYQCDGRLMAMNSYENRVYHVGMSEGEPLIAKFYRPGRWTDAAIAEEHDFTFELADAEIPAVPPIRDDRGDTLFRHGAYRFSLFPRRGGRPLELDNLRQLEQLGRFIGRIHLVGRTRTFSHRPTLDVDTFGSESYAYLLESGFIPPDLELAYRSLAEDLLVRIRRCYERAGDIALIRVHGDCHPGNISWTPDGPHIVDLDDARNAPAAQDIWMLLSGDREDKSESLRKIMLGYTAFCPFDSRELHLFEALRTLRLLYYYAWIARRWDDPAFPRVFTWFNTQRCWEDHILALREQAAEMDEELLPMD
jgi:Ser/Thr protein kinase RdoA (MazF antagonist)